MNLDPSSVLDNLSVSEKNIFFIKNRLSQKKMIYPFDPAANVIMGTWVIKMAA